MPPAVLYRKRRLATADRRSIGAVGLLVAIQLAAFGILIWSEAAPAAQACSHGARATSSGLPCCGVR